jgi:soluble lytic murein transglycosylase-like protein
MDYAVTPPAYVAMVEQEAQRHHVPAALIVAIISRESRWNTFAIGAANERGLMQVKPSTARALCPWEWRLLHWPQPAISCGATILRAHFKRCGTWVAAASAFNGSRNCAETNYGIEIMEAMK